MLAPGTTPSLFTLDPSYRLELFAKKPKWNFKGLSEFTFYRTYSRRKENGKLESWNECVARVIEGTFTILKTHSKVAHVPWDETKAQKLAQEAADRMFDLKWLPPGRGLWMMGTDFIWEKGGGALNNCAFVSTSRIAESPEEAIAPFRFLMDMSMLGVGVGFDVTGRNELEVLGYSDETVTYQVPDSREGWVEAAMLCLRNGLFNGPKVDLDVSLIRPEGEPIRGFGGTASGPAPLVAGCKGIMGILQARANDTSYRLTHNESLFHGRNNFLTTSDIVDIMNLLGKTVVSGNVRRSAEIAFAYPDDLEFKTLKNMQLNPVATNAAPPTELKEESQEDYDLYLANMYDPSNGICNKLAEKYSDRPWIWKIGGWRWASNNSIFANVGMDYGPYAKEIAETGEPGFAWLDLMRGYGRMKDPRNDKDINVAGGNPCLEQSLESYEVCCLVENFPGHAENYWDFQRTLKFSYLYAKAVTLMGTHVPRTNAVVIRNRRIGCSLSGVADAVAKFGRTAFVKEWCDKGYEYVTYLDKKYSRWLGVPESVKKTSNKPSGTVSLVAGAFGPGVNLPKMETGYRLVRVAKSSPLVEICESAGYKVEPSVTEPTKTAVIYFPWLAPEGIKTEDDANIWEQFKMAADMQKYWADNQVSATATFTQEEADTGQIESCLTAFDGELKGISLLMKFDAQYAQMPFTKAPRDEVEAYAATLVDLDFSELTDEGEDVQAKLFCDGDQCMIA